MTRDTARDWALLLLRVCGIGFAVRHGWGKVTALLAEGEEARFAAGVAGLGFPMPLFFAWAAALAEFAGGLLLAAGILTRTMAAFAAITMVVAAFVRHHLAQQVLVWIGLMKVPDETVEGWGNPELAGVYLAVFLALTLLGGGRFSLGPMLRRRLGGRR